MVLERNRYGRGQHRFRPGFLDSAGHCGFRPRLCQPYRARTKGKVERFIRHLRGSLWAPLASRVAAEGVAVDRAAANLAAGRWLREVANARVHATTGEAPALRLKAERGALRPAPPPCGGLALRPAPPSTPRTPFIGPQHPLAVHDALFAAPVVPGAAPRATARGASASPGSAPSCGWRRWPTSTRFQPAPRAKWVRFQSALTGGCRRRAPGTRPSGGAMQRAAVVAITAAAPARLAARLGPANDRRRHPQDKPGYRIGAATPPEIGRVVTAIASAPGTCPSLPFTGSGVVRSIH
ncbi:hypothetical protein GCM10009416_40590 [Craurococcus roseus]|uniref:Integrase catalytic domain-containing protein n=1 Tax=Craurococcus roseus TaxID=77585 RepID=A0ABN1FUW3_9PROT